MLEARRISPPGWRPPNLLGLRLAVDNRVLERGEATAMFTRLAGHGWVTPQPPLVGDVVLVSPSSERRTGVLHQLIWGVDWTVECAHAAAGDATARARHGGTLLVADAIGSQCDAFITSNRAILRAGRDIEAAHPGLQVLSPLDALSWLADEIELQRRRWTKFGFTPSLPAWPHPDDLASWRSAAKLSKAAPQRT